MFQDGGAQHHPPSPGHAAYKFYFAPHCFRQMSDSEDDNVGSMMTLAFLADKLVIAYLQVQ